MRQSIVLAVGFAAIAAASPTPQDIDFASVNSAPTPSLIGPPATATSQVITIDPAAVSSSASAAVTGVATASATNSVVDSKLKRGFAGWARGWGSYSTSTSTSRKSTSTSTATTAITISSTSTTAAPTTTAPVPTIVPCAVQPDGYGPKVQPDTPEAFEAYAEFSTEALNAVTPSPYTATFINYNASVQGSTYLGLTTYTSYDVAECGSQCDSTSLCTGFNIYVERDPSVDPSTNCSNPASITNYKCTLWGSSVDKSLATNFGQWRNDFQVVIAGSNAYTKTCAPPGQPGWSPPQSCGGGNHAHSHPQTCLGQHFFPGPYNPAYCASFAVSQNSVNAKQIPSALAALYNMIGYNPYKSTFFNSYMLKKNGKPMGTYCSLFTESYSSSQATYNPGQQGTDTWDVESSWTYSIN